MLELWLSIAGVPISDGPIFSVISADIVLQELGQFSASAVVLPGADRRALLALTPYTLCEVVQPGVGTLCYGYVLRPQQQITTNDDHTITLTLEPITTELMWRTTRRGWVAQNWLSVVAQRLASGVAGWSSTFTGTGTAANDLQVSVNFNQETYQQAYLDLAKQFACYARQGVASDLSPKDPGTLLPVRALEMGQFGAAPAVWLASGNGASPDDAATNGLVRLVATIDRIPADATNLVNVAVPFGGGSTSDTLVTLERLWRIVNDAPNPAVGHAGYVNWGRFGTDAESLARTGLPSLFPEYDHAHYPITDPDTANPPTNTYDANGNLLQGWYTTRAVTLDGHWDYVVVDAASHALYGHKEGTFVDSSLTYADSSVANQELTERALYMSAVANFKRFAHPHDAFTCTTPAQGRPTRAGDLIAIDYQRVSMDTDAAIVELNVVENLRVMRVVRHFQGDAVPMDEYTLSNLGRFDEDDASGAAAAAGQLVALQINQGTSLAPMTVNDRGNVDALHPLVTHISVPKQKYRWGRCNLRVDFMPYTATTNATTNSPATITVSIPHGTHTIQHADGSGAIAATGVATSTDQIGGMPAHVHQIAETGTPLNRAPTGTDNWLYGFTDGSGQTQIVSSKGQTGQFKTGTQILNIDLAPTAAGHTVPIAPTVAPQFSSLSGPLPQHTHPLDQRIPDGPLPSACLVDINGQFLSSNLLLLSGTRNPDGSFASGFEVDDISAMLNGIAGDLTVTLHAGTNAANPFGTGMFVLSMTLFGEFGGLTSSVAVAS